MNTYSHSRLPFAFWWCTALVQLAVLLLAVTSSEKESQTHDEAVHIAAGYSYWKTGDFRLNLEHPPISKLIQSLPLVALHPLFSPPTDAWERADEFTVGKYFLYRNWVPAEELLLLARLVTIAMSSLLALSVAIWVAHRAGAGAGLVSLVLLSLEPTVLAHSRYATSDVPVVMFIWVSCISWYSCLERPSVWKLTGTGILTGLAITTKFNALILFPILVLTWIVFYSFTSQKQFRDGKNIVMVFIISALLVILAVYRFDTRSIAADPMLIQRLHQAYPDQTSVRGRLIHAFLQVPIPGYYFFRGLHLLIRHNHSGHLTYLNGVISHRGSWNYFPTALLVKSSVAWLLLLLGSISVASFRLIRSGVDQRGWLYLSLLLPTGTYFAVSLFSSIAIGIRHLLPIYPFVSALMAIVLFKECSNRIGSACKWILVSIFVIESLSAYPGYVSFFNGLVGGARNGPKYLLDSNLDWGQDLKRLKSWLQTHDATPLCLSYFGTAEPSYYGISYQPLPEVRGLKDIENLNCVVAISAEHLFGLTEAPFAALQRLPIAARVGDSIYVYDLRRTTEFLRRSDGPL